MCECHCGWYKAIAQQRARVRVSRIFRKYSTQYSSRGITGAQAARMLLDSKGLQHIQIHKIGGELSDHFDPRTNEISLSEGVYGSTSTAAIGVACHEVGHAIQHAEGYAPLKLRNAVIPISSIGSQLAIPLIFLGLALSYFSQVFTYVAYFGIICFMGIIVFQLLTLPTEFDASRRALAGIENRGFLSSDEAKGAKKVLSAAALTYVAAMAVSVAQVLRFILILSSRRD